LAPALRRPHPQHLRRRSRDSGPGDRAAAAGWDELRHIVIAGSPEGATKQSRFSAPALDCFASLAMTQRVRACDQSRPSIATAATRFEGWFVKPLRRWMFVKS